MNQPANHFPQAPGVVENISKLKALYSRYNEHTGLLDRLADEAGCFTVRLPLVGAFSAGKTTLINALIEEKLFAVEVNPETALPVELHYAPVAEFKGFTSDGQSKALSYNAVQQQQFQHLLPDGWLQAGLPAENLKQLAQLTLVDMPGWDSGISQHAKAIDAYLHRSLAYCLVVSADEGSLRDSLRLFIQELAIRKMPVLLVITKADKKPQEDIDAVEEQITAEVTKVLGQPLLGVVQVSARKRQIQGFISLLNTLQGGADERFFRAITDPVVKDSQKLAKRLMTLINQDNLDAESLQAERQKLQGLMQEFTEKVTLETQALDAQVYTACSNIMVRVESGLIAQLDNLASQIVNNGDLQGAIGSTLRLAFSESVHAEFSPKLKSYFQRIEQEVPDVVSKNMDIPVRTGTSGSESKYFDTSQVLGAFMDQPVLPKSKIPFDILIPIVIKLFEYFSKKRQEQQRKEQMEAAKQQIINTVIPQVKSDVEPVLRKHLLEQTEVAKQHVLAVIEEQLQQYRESLNQLEEELKEGEERFNQQRQEYQQDLEQVKSIQAALVG